jgi:Carboxypeptidase regulatory-like domain
MRIAVALGILVAIGAGCTRYEYINETELPECRNRGLPARPPELQWVAPATAVAPGTLLGRVVDTTGVAVWSAQVALATDTAWRSLRPPTRRTLTDSLGRFRLDSVAPGHYTLFARRIGFESVRGPVDVPADRALLVTTAPAIMDGPCSGFSALRVRKPFWKLW